MSTDPSTHPSTEAADWRKSTGSWPHPCPNGKCEHAGHFHDIDTYEDPKPMCVFGDCPCGKPTVAPSTEAERREVSDEKASGGTIEPGEQYRVGESGCVAAPSTEAVGEVRRSESRNLTALVGVRLLPEEHERALVLADRADLTVASLLRGLLRDHIEEIGETESEQERRRLIGDDWTTNIELEQAVAEVKQTRGMESMPAYQLAKLLPEHLRQPFWEDAVKYYLADALALTEAVERDGCWVPLAEATQLRSDLSAMTLERDLAIAYDRQAYPTADAYERVCASHRRYRDLADRATAFLVNLADHDAKVGGVEAGKLRSEFAAHVATQPDLCSLVDQLEQALQQLSAMTSDRDWLRTEFEKASAEIAELRQRLAAHEFALAAEQATMSAVVGEAQKLAVAKWVRRPSTDTVELNPED